MNEVEVLKWLPEGSSAARKYGPFFFALLLLVGLPFIHLFVFKNGGMAQQEFRRNLRISLYAGVVCMTAAVGWFFYENYREVDEYLIRVPELEKKVAALESKLGGMNYIATGMILGSMPSEHEFQPTLSSQDIRAYFAKNPLDGSWYFLLVSPKEIPHNLEIPIIWVNNPSGGGAAQLRIKLDPSSQLYAFTKEAYLARLIPVPSQ